MESSLCLSSVISFKTVGTLVDGGGHYNKILTSSTIFGVSGSFFVLITLSIDGDCVFFGDNLAGEFVKIFYTGLSVASFDGSPYI